MRSGQDPNDLINRLLAGERLTETERKKARAQMDFGVIEQFLTNAEKITDKVKTDKHFQEHIGAIREPIKAALKRLIEALDAA